eukprot:jgi/Tetstr1/424000/TSEL_014611.t1
MAEGATDSIACSAPDASLVQPSNTGRKPQKPRPKKDTPPKIRPRVNARTSPRLILAEAEPASPDGTTRPMVCKEAWMFIHKVGFLPLRRIRAEVDGLVNPGCSRNAPPVYHIASRAATRAWLKDYFDPKHGRTEKIPNPSSDREEWHLPAWANKAKVYITYMDDDTYWPSSVIDWKEFLGGALPTKGHGLSISQAYQFSVRKPEKPIDHAVHAEIFMSQWSDTDVHGPEDVMKFMPEGNSSYLHGRLIFHSHKDGRSKTLFLCEVDAEKRFDDMESHILFLAAKFDFYADDIEEWVHTLRELREKQWEESRPFDKFCFSTPAKQVKVVIMDMSKHHENITEAERLDLLGDWEATRSMGKIRSHKDLKDPDESKMRLKLVLYEPWVPDCSGNPEIPLWLAVDIARIEGRPIPDTN